MITKKKRMTDSIASWGINNSTDSYEFTTTTNFVKNATLGHGASGDTSYKGKTTEDDISSYRFNKESLNDYYPMDVNGSNYSYGFYNYDEYYFEIFKFETYALGYVQPVLIILTALTNIFVIGYFLTRKKRGKATNLLFVSIALSDTMTGVTLLPNSFGVYAIYNDYLTRNWCNAYMTLRMFVSPVFHTVSVWQTVLLCIQRYMCVCHPFIPRRICTFWKTFISILVMYICAAVLHVYHLVNNKLVHVQCEWDFEIPCKGLCVYLWFCLAFQHLLPCLLLVSLTSVTIKEMGMAHKRLTTMSFMRNIRRFSRDKMFTRITALIALFFIIPELPHGIYRLVFLIYIHKGNFEAISAEEHHIITCVYELALTISFSANFWIYCFMMRDFRFRVYELLTCGSFKRGLGRLRKLSQSSRGEENRSPLSRSSSNVSKNLLFSRTASLQSTASENFQTKIQLTPTGGYDGVNFNLKTGEGTKDDVIDDDVFM